MIFQEPMTALNPVFSIGFQIAEAVRAHRRLSRRAALDEAARLLDRVAIPAARQRLKDYPHQLSGGQRQRAAIAESNGSNATPRSLQGSSARVRNSGSISAAASGPRCASSRSSQ